MDVKEAVAAAKEHFREAFEDEHLKNTTLEEVWFDDLTNEWCVTLGIRHRMVEERSSVIALGNKKTKEQIDYKTVRISDKDGKVISIRIRDMAAA